MFYCQKYYCYWVKDTQRYLTQIYVFIFGGILIPNFDIDWLLWVNLLLLNDMFFRVSWTNFLHRGSSSENVTGNLCSNNFEKVTDYSKFAYKRNSIIEHLFRIFFITQLFNACRTLVNSGKYNSVKLLCQILCWKVLDTFFYGYRVS